MINSNWTDPCHHIKQDPVKGRKKDAQYNGEDTTDMTFIGPDADMLSITRKGKVLYLSIIWKYYYIRLFSKYIFLINRA